MKKHIKEAIEQQLQKLHGLCDDSEQYKERAKDYLSFTSCTKVKIDDVVVGGRNIGTAVEFNIEGMELSDVATIEKFLTATEPKVDKAPTEDEYANVEALLQTTMELELEMIRMTHVSGKAIAEIEKELEDHLKEGKALRALLKSTVEID